MNVVSKELTQNYLQALQADEAEIHNAAEDYQRARARVDVALLRYTALRDFMTTTLGCSPYSGHIEWPDDGRHHSERGRFRYSGMKVGDAVVEVLKGQYDGDLAGAVLQALAPGEFAGMSLDEIIQALSEGGFGFPDPVSARVVNASLMRTAGIARHVTDSGQTRYTLTPDHDDPEGGQSELEDLPYE